MPPARVIPAAPVARRVRRQRRGVPTRLTCASHARPAHTNRVGLVLHAQRVPLPLQRAQRRTPRASCALRGIMRRRARRYASPAPVELPGKRPARRAPLSASRVPRAPSATPLHPHTAFPAHRGPYPPSEEQRAATRASPANRASSRRATPVLIVRRAPPPLSPVRRLVTRASSVYRATSVPQDRLSAPLVPPVRFARVLVPPARRSVSCARRASSPRPSGPAARLCASPVLPGRLRLRRGRQAM